MTRRTCTMATRVQVTANALLQRIPLETFIQQLTNDDAAAPAPAPAPAPAASGDAAGAASTDAAAKLPSGNTSGWVCKDWPLQEMDDDRMYPVLVKGLFCNGGPEVTCKIKKSTGVIKQIGQALLSPLFKTAETPEIVLQNDDGSLQIRFFTPEETKSFSATTTNIGAKAYVYTEPLNTLLDVKHMLSSYVGGEETLVILQKPERA